MKIFDFKNKINNEEFSQCITSINNGKIVVLPTDTVYGIAVDATNQIAVENLYKVKKRSKKNPINVLVSSKDMAKKCVKDFNKTADILIEKFWPGPLTIVFEKNEYIKDIVTAGKETIGIRMPENEVTLKIIDKVNKPLAVPSANISGRPSGTSIEDIVSDFCDNVDIYIDYGESKIGIESTIVKINDDSVSILRQGKITKNEIEALGIKVIELEKENNFKHYKIDTNCKIVYNVDNLLKIKELNDSIRNNIDKKIAVITFEEDIQHIDEKFNIDIYNLKSKDNLEFAMKNIYKILREIDSKKYDICLISLVDKTDKTEGIINIFKEMCK